MAASCYQVDDYSENYNFSGVTGTANIGRTSGASGTITVGSNGGNEVLVKNIIMPYFLRALNI